MLSIRRKGQLARYPKGRKDYNGRVERSHRTDDGECYRPYLLNISNLQGFLTYGQRWVYFCNVLRPHFGADMNGCTPLAMLQSLGYAGDAAIAAFPPVLLDELGTDLLMACGPTHGIDLLTHYTLEGSRGSK